MLEKLKSFGRRFVPAAEKASGNAPLSSGTEWTVEVILDEDKTDVGTVTAIHNAGQPDEVVYTKRMNVTIDAAKFITEAKAAVTAKQTRVTRETDAATTLVAALNK